MATSGQPAPLRVSAAATSSAVSRFRVYTIADAAARPGTRRCAASMTAAMSAMRSCRHDTSRRCRRGAAVPLPEGCRSSGRSTLSHAWRSSRSPDSQALASRGPLRHLVRQGVGIADAVVDVGAVKGRHQASRPGIKAQLLHDVVLHLQHCPPSEERRSVCSCRSLEADQET